MTTPPAQAEHSNLLRSHLRWSWLFLGVALLWSGVAVAMLLGYHVPEPLGMTAITTNGHTYYGNPPALTLFERDPVSFVTVSIILGAGLLVATADLIVRSARRTPRAGTAAIVAGAIVVLISLFGLLIGVAGVGVVGALLIASGVSSIRQSVA
ncbi:MAG: hypothetical protein ACYC19_03755 [Acidimicrobiales bacterium]